MKKRLQGLIVGILIGSIVTSGAVFAKTGSEMIEAVYSNIKIYVDGVKVTPKDANGKTVEPFIYNGTTYLPVRAVGQAIGKQVTWDGATKTVYIGEAPGQVNYLTDVCPAYEYNQYEYKECTSSNGESFSMGGKQRTNGLYAQASTDINGTSNEACYNLNGKYKRMSFIAGAVDNSLLDVGAKIRIYADGKIVKTIDIANNVLPKEYTVDLNYALQMRIEFVSNQKGYGIGKIGMADIVLE